MLRRELKSDRQLQCVEGAEAVVEGVPAEEGCRGRIVRATDGIDQKLAGGESSKKRSRESLAASSDRRRLRTFTARAE